MKHLAFLLFLVVFACGHLDAQIITVKVQDAIPYIHKPNSYTFRITENAMRVGLDPEEDRKAEFDSEMNSLTTSLKEEGIDYEIIEPTGEIKLPRGSMRMFSVDLTIPAERFEQFSSLIQTFMESSKLSIMNTSQFIDGDDHLETCLEITDKKAKQKAEMFANAKGRQLGELSELRVIKYFMQSNLNVGLFSEDKTADTPTHYANIELEYSFHTVEK